MKNLHTFRQCVASSHTIFPVPTLFLQAAATDAAIEALARTTTSAQSAAKYENRTHGMAIATNFPNTQPSKASCIVCGCMCVLRCGCALERGLQISLTRGVVVFFLLVPSPSTNSSIPVQFGTIPLPFTHARARSLRANLLIIILRFNARLSPSRAYLYFAARRMLACPAFPWQSAWL